MTAQLITAICEMVRGAHVRMILSVCSSTFMSLAYFISVELDLPVIRFIYTTLLLSICEGNKYHR